MSGYSRREFARHASLATALSYSRIQGANDRVGIGYIGLGNRGDQVHEAFLEYSDQQTVAVCDLRDDYMDLAAKKCGTNPRRYKDYRKLLEDKDVDAVVIATPDHWHALMFIDACNAGKDVYVEKPLSLTVVEGRRMVEVAERTKRVTQVGIHRRSAPFLREAAEFVRSGGIGHVTVAKGYHVLNEWPLGIGNPPDEPPPNEWEWEQWLGACAESPLQQEPHLLSFPLVLSLLGAASLPTSACTTWTCCAGAWVRTHRAPWSLWEASTRSRTTGKFPIRWRCCGSGPGRL
jgi:hypothetical protein